LGFSPDEGQRALSRCAGKLDPACNLLFEEKEKGPSGKASSSPSECTGALSNCAGKLDAADNSLDQEKDQNDKVACSSPSECTHAASSSSLPSGAGCSSCKTHSSESLDSTLTAALQAQDDEEVLWEPPESTLSAPPSPPPPQLVNAADSDVPLEPVATIEHLRVGTEGASDGVDPGEASGDDFEQGTDKDCSEDSALDDDTEELPMTLVHPDGESWDWPLSFKEKKSRIAQFEHLEREFDKKMLIQEIVDLRDFKRRSTVGSRRRDSRAP